MDIDLEIKNRRKSLEAKRSENELLERQARKEEDSLLESTASLQLSTEGLEFLEELANSRRGSMKGRIETVLTEALQLVYQDDRKIELVYGVKNNRSHLDFELVKGNISGEIRRVLDGTGSGLGVSDTVSVPLRLLVLLGSKQSERVCILDECYKHMDVERVPILTQFLKVLTERLNIQVILLSHHESVKEEADASFEVRMVNEKSVIRKT
jgi:hypothetical protein